jgi:hypothetical protein
MVEQIVSDSGRQKADETGDQDQAKIVILRQAKKNLIHVGRTARLRASTFAGVRLRGNESPVVP